MGKRLDNFVCSECVFFSALENDVEGTCRKSAPLPNYADPGGSIPKIANWPVVKLNDWCGDFSANWPK